MKFTLSAFTLLFSLSTFATPFDAFEGEYATSGTPVITGNQMRECNWANFKGIKGVSISKDTDGQQMLVVSSIMSNSPVSVGFPLKAYDFSGPSGARNVGVFDGGSGRAQYQQINTVSNFREVLTWEMSEFGSGYSFYMAYQVRDQFGVNGSCFYSVPLSKK